MLNYLPLDRSKWTEFLRKRRNEYKEFVRETIIRPGINNHSDGEEKIDHVNMACLIIYKKKREREREKILFILLVAIKHWSRL